MLDLSIICKHSMILRIRIDIKHDFSVLLCQLLLKLTYLIFKFLVSCDDLFRRTGKLWVKLRNFKAKWGEKVIFDFFLQLTYFSKDFCVIQMFVCYQLVLDNNDIAKNPF